MEQKRDSVSLRSIQSEDWYDEEKPKQERRTSIAASLTQAILVGSRSQKKESGLSLQQGSNFRDDELEDMYLEDVLASGKKERQRQENIRATLGFWELVWYDLKVWYRLNKLKNKESVLFKTYIKNMESNFGSAIGSLFVFTRWVLVWNVVLSVMWLSFVVIPMAAHFDYSRITQNFAFKNLLDGKGAVAQSLLFFGSYDERTPGGYHTGLAYFLMLLVTYFGSLYVILGSLNQKQVNKSASAVTSRFRFSLLLWTSWDHTITSNEASINLSKGITSTFKDNLYEVKATQRVKERSTRQKIRAYLWRTLAWLITVILIGGGCTAIVYLVLYTNFSEVIPNKGSGEQSDFVSTYATTIIFSLINLLVPSCIRLLPKLEQYESGRDELNITLTRIFFLRMANLFALISSLYNTVTQEEVFQLGIAGLLAYCGGYCGVFQSLVGCAGTVIGQELYKVVILDTIIHSTVQLLKNHAKYFWTRQKNEFDISSAVLVLIYRQALVWTGTLACPVMPVLGVVSDLVFFYVIYSVVWKTCKPPIKRWNQSRNTSFFSLFLLGSLALIIPPMSIVLGSSKLVNLGKTGVEGHFCGPFGSDKPTLTVVKYGQDHTTWLRDVLYWMFSEAVLLPVFFILFSVTIHQRSQISIDKEHQTILQAELLQEREENEKLIKKLQSVGIGVDRKF